jgi:hypothetical protein
LSFIVDWDVVFALGPSKFAMIGFVLRGVRTMDTVGNLTSFGRANHLCDVSQASLEWQMKSFISHNRRLESETNTRCGTHQKSLTLTDPAPRVSRVLQDARTAYPRTYGGGIDPRLTGASGSYLRHLTWQLKRGNCAAISFGKFIGGEAVTDKYT